MQVKKQELETNMEQWTGSKLGKEYVKAVYCHLAYLIYIRVSQSVQSLSHVWLCNPMNHSMPGPPVHHQLPESTQTHVHWVSDAIQPSLPLSPSSLPALNLSQHQGLFQWVSSSHQVPKYLSFRFSTGPYNQYSGLISFGIDSFALLAVQGTLKSLLQHHSSKHQFFCLYRYTSCI